jgi:hypothetical protein
MTEIKAPIVGLTTHEARTRTWLLAAGIMLVVLALAGALAIVPAAFPSVGADSADLLRAVIGPKPVAELESLSFSLQDSINRVRSSSRGGRPLISWSNQGQVPTTSSASIHPAAKAPSHGAPLPSSAVAMYPTQLEWQAYGPTPDGAPLMERALMLVDPQRSYAGVALVRINLTRLQLHIMPGSIEPAHPSHISQFIPDPGMIPSAYQNQLVAAFNGGFKSIHGHYGMMVNGLTLLSPIPNLATVAVYKDGHVAIGTWGKDMVLSPDMLAYRQNCPPLIDAGVINPSLSLDNRTPWGFTDNSDITWRTGLGITQDGRTLIYAVGNGTSAASLAQALSEAGAYAAMQLDINQYYARFYTYAPVSNPPDAQGFFTEGRRLLDQMINNPHLYLTPNPRDFFYLTLR